MSGRLVSHFGQGGTVQLPAVPTTSRLSPAVFVALGMNPGPFSLQGTNTYLVGKGARRILVDTGDADFSSEYIPVLRRAVSESGAVGIEQIVLTHWHRDHIGGVREVLKCYGVEVPVRRFVPAVEEDTWGEEGSVSVTSHLEGCNVVPLTDGEILSTEGATLRAIHTPGHASDHICLVLEEERAIFTGDNVLGTGTPVFRDLPLYLGSLRRILAEKPQNLYTSHGPLVSDGAKLINEYIEHRMARVLQVRQVLASGEGWMSAEEITREIYHPDVYPENLIVAAIGNTVQALHVLQEEALCEVRGSFEQLGGDVRARSSSLPSNM